MSKNLQDKTEGIPDPKELEAAKKKMEKAVKERQIVKK
jgi:hypothetical protein